ncbi:hypothetical protein QWY87_04335 [Lutimonas halocynthiae]|uniref:ABC transporter substrate-binding protein n=1 Tax=Lutimonas halocynthiae TaxID=1446477 RepID=UPI0025B3FB58|nr:hypothetical protein [Lutimonas halocynthiae]MDN3641914.1 hypothetical protein [Lutimonas halocynthiae]
MAKKTTLKPDNSKNLESGLGDLAKLVLGKLDEHGLTMEQAVSAMQAAGTEVAAEKAAKPPKKAPAKKAKPKSTAVINVVDGQKLSTVALDWKQVWYTNCPMVSANNVDQELGWCRQEFKNMGIEYDYMRHTRDNDFYPHYRHNLKNLIRFGGLYPPIAVHADLSKTVLLGATWVYEGGCMAVRIDDKISQMKDLKGKKIGLSKSMNTLKNDWWRIQEHMGILSMLELNNMTKDDVEIVEFPYPDDWYNDPKMLAPMNNPTDLWAARDHKHDLAFRPLETALLEGKVDAIYTQSKVFQHLQEDTGKIKMIEDLSRYPDWTKQVANTPAIITCTKEMADKHPELVVAYMKAMVKVGHWANQHKPAASAILDHQTFYRDAQDTYRGIKDVDMVPSLNATNMKAIKIGKDFMLEHGYIKNDFDVDKWARPEFLQQGVHAWMEEEYAKKSWGRLKEGAVLNKKA